MSVLSRAARPHPTSKSCRIELGEPARDLAAALSARGWRVLEEQDDARLDPSVVVLGNGPRDPDVPLGRAETYRRLGGSGAIVLVLRDPREAHLRWASALTPFCPPPADASPLAGFVEQAHALWSRAAPADPPPARHVTIRLWEALEIDGRPVYLGCAERNFLFSLAQHRGLRVPKDERIEAGTRRVLARECRRRLGRRLGPELANLLVPVERDEPYRFREAEEVAATCRLRPDEHPFTHLRVHGRSSVRTINLELPELA